MMTRKDYTRAAALVNEHWHAMALTRNIKNGKLSEAQSREVMKLVALQLEDTFIQFFEGDNPRFDETRFREACRK